MAIDTAAKRRRMLGFGVTPGILPPVPTGQLGPAARAGLVGLYQIPGNTPPPPDPIPVVPGGSIDASALVLIIPGIMRATG